MTHLTLKGAKMLAKRLKRILQEEFSENSSLGECQTALAEGFDFGSASDMFRKAPTDTVWNRDWCANCLSDRGYVSTPGVAQAAVRRLEESYGDLFVAPGRDPRSSV